MGNTHHEQDESYRRWNATPVNTRIMVAAVVVLFVVVLFILLLHVYARWFWRNSRFRSRGGWSRRRRRFHFAAADIAPVQESGVMSKGLDKSVLETLPIFYYTKGGESEMEALDCAVCLSEFEENEGGRRLPKCNHVFHTDCIDMWFGSHTTCPLCRASVVSVDGENGKEEQVGEELLREAVMVGLQGRGEENSIAIQILQDEGAVLLTEAAAQHDRLPPSLNSQGTIEGGGGSAAAPSGMQQQSQFPASVLFWGNQTYVSSAVSPTLSQQDHVEIVIGDKVGTSSTTVSPSPRKKHLAIEVPRRSSGNLSSACSSQLTSPTTVNAEGQRSPGLGTHLRNLKRLLSPRRCSLDVSPDCCEQQQSLHSASHTPTSAPV